MRATSPMNGSHDSTERQHRYVLHLHEVDRTDNQLVGAKGANLGELSRIAGIRVPAGFCVTTNAFRRIIATAPSADNLVTQLAQLSADDRRAIRTLSAAVRDAIEAITIPDDLAQDIKGAIEQLGVHDAYAVRSSATAEDSPATSFAGQQDTYLNVSGVAAILQHISRCWASLFTERAVSYRLRNGLQEHAVDMAVIVQRMVFPRAAGVLFTADPVSGNRKVSSIDASFGLGEALVAGLVNPDVYKIRGDTIISKTIATKQVVFEARPTGSTRRRALSSEQQSRPALTDADAIRLAHLGRKIEAHFGRPQDIEWCLVDDDFHIVQSRPITTLFPIPAADDGENHVYVSTGHQQMMTDAMKPLGVSVRQMTAMRPMPEAGGRLWVDVTDQLASPATRAGILMLGKSDPLIGDALQTIVDRGDFLPVRSDVAVAPPPKPAATTLATDPAIPAELVANAQASNAKLDREIAAKSGPELIDFIVADLQELRRILFDPRSHRAIMAGMEATWWLNDHLEQWLGEKNAADVLAQSVPNNVTSEMGLDLLQVADVVRRHPDVIALLQRADNERFLNDLATVPGGAEARGAIQSWLDRYGMRGVGEIDITRTRWSERPSALVPLILSNVKNFTPGEGERRFARGLEAAAAKERTLLERLRALTDGEDKARQAKAMIDRLRTFVGYREYPKYFIVSRYYSYKRALMREAERLVEANVLREREDMFFVTLPELQEIARTRIADYDVINERKESFKIFERLTPPRVLTSDGEMLGGAYRRDDAPAGSLVGLAVSAGVVEGRARVISDAAKADLEPGDILVTTYTDPSWTPLFVAIKGLITEVGGLMTHGAVIAREYGLPAVVGVKNATKLIRDGQRIRVDGTNGYVAVLDHIESPADESPRWFIF